ncbi:hypothetical protein Slala05_43610 [Streptomyces lavendulae subsp. lavendulae]|nr:hypothetical protein Slala05_43610 [Streptomyces lavendulae subsp. lavendulae]
MRTADFTGAGGAPAPSAPAPSSAPPVLPFSPVSAVVMGLLPLWSALIASCHAMDAEIESAAEVIIHPPERRSEY